MKLGWLMKIRQKRGWSWIHKRQQLANSSAIPFVEDFSENYIFFRSRAYTRKGSSEDTFFRMFCSYNCKFNFFLKLNYGTPHMTIYGAQMKRKWTRSWSEVKCGVSTSAGCLRSAIFLTKTSMENFGKILTNYFCLCWPAPSPTPPTTQTIKLVIEVIMYCYV